MSEHFDNPEDGYPNAAGFKGQDGTSEAAAVSITPHVGRLRRVVLETVAARGPSTMLEAVAETRFERESLQPRFSELRRLGMLEPNGERRKNPSGKNALVWQLTPKGREAIGA